MINREEIKRFIEARKAESTMNFVWDIFTTMIPGLCSDDLDGDDRRLGLAEHVIHKFFASASAKTAPGDTFVVFCRHFRANEQDIATARTRTQEDLESVEVDEADIATTMAWLWFVKAAEKYELYDVELKFLLYSIADMSRGDQKILEAGKRNLVSEVTKDPNLLLRLLSCAPKKQSRC